MIRSNKIFQLNLLLLLISLMAVNGFYVEGETYELPMTVYVTGELEFRTSAKLVDDAEIGDMVMLSPGFRTVEKVEDGVVKTSASAILKAPVLYEGPVVSDPQENEYDIVMDGTEQIDDEIIVDPALDVTEEGDFGFELLIGTPSYVVENTTNNVDLSAHDITDNALISAAHYLVLENGHTLDTASNSTVKVSFATAAAGNITDPAICTNTTIFNGLMISSMSYWWNLNLENTNDSLTYVINVYIDNINVDGFFLLDTESSGEVKDLRYETIYLGSDLDLVAGLPIELDELGLPINQNWDVYEGVKPTYSSRLGLQSLWETVTPADIFSVSTDFDEIDSDAEITLQGWLTREELNDDIKEAFALDAEVALEDVTDFTILTFKTGHQVNAGLSREIYNRFRDACEDTSDLATAMKKTLDEGPIKGVYMLQDNFVKSAFSLGGIGDWVNNACDDVGDFTGGLIGSAMDGLGEGGQWVVDSGNDILSNIGDALEGLVESVVGDGGVGGWFDTIIMPLAVVAGIGLVLFIYLRFGRN